MAITRLIGITAVLMLAGVVYAKSPHGEESQHGGRFMMHLEELDLSDAQRAEMEQIFQENRPQMQAHRQRMRALHERIKALDESGYSPQAIDAISRDFGELEAEKMRQRLTLKASINDILTQEQRAKLKELRKEHRAAMREKWREHRERASE